MCHVGNIERLVNGKGPTDPETGEYAGRVDGVLLYTHWDPLGKRFHDAICSSVRYEPSARLKA